MNPLLKFPRIQFVLATGICSLLLLGGAAMSQDVLPEAPEKARALLDQVKKSELDRQIAVKQTEIERLKEDQDKIERDSDGLKKTTDSTSGLITDSTEQLTTLTGESRRLEHELAVAEARINAERLKIEGLKALTEAQGKSLSALGRRAEEAAARSHLRSIELEMLEAGKQVPGEGREEISQTELIKARKALAAAEVKSESEERGARDAMKAAAAKMVLAEASATRAQRLADNDLTLIPVATVVKPKVKAPEKTAEKPAEKAAPVATGPKPAVAGPSKPASTAAAATSTAATTSKAASGGAAPAARRQ